jgi:hypothetical protein
MEFFQTPMGRRFYESTAPDIATALTRIAERLDHPLPTHQDEVKILTTMVADLLDCTELNMDSMEEETRETIARAGRILRGEQ